jgi:hypothetical protein
LIFEVCICTLPHKIQFPHKKWVKNEYDNSCQVLIILVDETLYYVMALWERIWPNTLKFYFTWSKGIQLQSSKYIFKEISMSI